MRVSSGLLTSAIAFGLLASAGAQPKSGPSPASPDGLPAQRSTEILLTTPDKAKLDHLAFAKSNPALEAKIKELENRFEAAIARQDADAFATLLADDFVGTTPEGKTQMKNEWLAALRASKDVYSSASYLELKVRVLANNVAICTGVAREVGRRAHGENFDDRIRFTDTWVERDGKWQCAASHLTLLPAKP